MRRTDLTAATMQGWARLDRLERRARLRRRLQNPLLAAPFDPANLFRDSDISHLVRRTNDAVAVEDQTHKYNRKDDGRVKDRMSDLALQAPAG